MGHSCSVLVTPEGLNDNLGANQSLELKKVDPCIGLLWTAAGRAIPTCGFGEPERDEGC